LPARVLAAGVAALLVAGLVWLLVPGAHSWHDLDGKYGRIRWVETRTDPLIQPPFAPQWIRTLHRYGIPWPTDLPLEQPSASFGGPGRSVDQTVAWFLIESDYEPNELWKIDKNSVAVFDREKHPVPWPGGTGSSRVDDARHLSYVWLGVPPGLSGTGAHLRFRLMRLEGAVTRPVELRL
jgi:hypothetical protein